MTHEGLGRVGTQRGYAVEIQVCRMRCQCSRNTRIDRVQSIQVQVTGITGELCCDSGGKRRDAVQPECGWAHEVGEPVKSVRKCFGHVERQRG